MDMINTLTVGLLREFSNISPIWFGIIIGVITIVVLPIRSMAEKAEDIGIMLEDYDDVCRRDISHIIPILYDLIDQFHESKLNDPDYFWDARTDIDPESGDGLSVFEPSEDDMLNMDYPETLQLRRTSNATNLLYLASHPSNPRRNPDAADSLALAIGQMITNRQAGPPLRRHRQRYLPANVQGQHYRPELITIHPPPSERPPRYFTYIVDRRSLPADYQGGVLYVQH